MSRGNWRAQTKRALQLDLISVIVGAVTNALSVEGNPCNAS
jgi:hypothetical protein